MFYLWSRYHVLSWVSLYDIYYDALEAWRQVRSNDATLRNLLYVLEIEELHYSAGIWSYLIASIMQVDCPYFKRL